MCLENVHFVSSNTVQTGQPFFLGGLVNFYCTILTSLVVLFWLYPSVQRGSKPQEQIVIGTPGTMLDWCSKLKFIDPKKIKVFVLDEADVMIATQGHQDHSIRIQRSE